MGGSQRMNHMISAWRTKGATDGLKNMSFTLQLETVENIDFLCIASHSDSQVVGI